MDAEFSILGVEVVGRSDSFGDEQIASLVIVQQPLLPEGVVDDRLQSEPRLPECVADPPDRGVQFFGDVVEEVGDVHRDVVSVRDRGTVAFVPVQQDDDASNLTELRQQLVESIDVDRIDDPHRTVGFEGVTRPLHGLFGVGDPADAVFVAVDLGPLVALAGCFHCHVSE